MAKTAKIKSNSSSNPRSRASKRALSPSTAESKTLVSEPRAEDATPNITPAYKQYAGVTKKKNKTVKSRAQRLRQERGMARAEAVLDQLEIKVVESKERARTVKERAKEWEDVNGRARQKGKVLEHVANGEVEADTTGMEDVIEEEDVGVDKAHTVPNSVPTTFPSTNGQLTTEDTAVAAVQAEDLPLPVTTDEDLAELDNIT